MDTGIRNADAESGALTVATSLLDMTAANAEMQRQLLAVRPYGGTPIAAALDDLYWYFEHDAATAAERDDARRERHVVLITDGVPDTDYREVNCDCRDQDPRPCDGTALSCPYPTAGDAARALRCGYGEDCTEGAVSSLHVIALDIEPVVREMLTSIGLQGGIASTNFVSDSTGIREALLEVLEEIASPNGACWFEGDLHAQGVSFPDPDRCATCMCSSGEVTCSPETCASAP